MSLHLVTAPRLGPLLAHLADTLRHTPLPPAEQETIVVQSQGMRRWLTLQLADVFGCAGSLALPFPAAFVRDLGGRLAGERPGREERDPFSRDVLTWRVDAWLRTLPERDARFQPLRSYLAGGDDRTRLGLAAQVAARLDDYQMFRADLLDAWEQGADVPARRHAAWQAELWRALVAQGGDRAPHMATRLQRAITALRDGALRGDARSTDADRQASLFGDASGTVAPGALPSRLTVFGVSTLPPRFVELLDALARHVPVTVYCAALAPDAPHPLAQAFGTQSREFLHALASLGAVHTVLDHRDGRRPGGVLATLQDELAAGVPGDAPLPMTPDDRSLRVHEAHGEVRQLEIVRDQLLDALAADPTLRPHDLLLLVPDATAWAPLVDAVFGVGGDDVPRLPYRIADRALRHTQPAAEAFVQLLALEGGRFERHEVLGLLAHPLVRQGAGLSDGEIELLEPLLQRANVRWGYDGPARVALGLPDYEDATWRAGLDRLLLGLAVGRRDDELLGLLPEAGDTAGEGDAIARLAAWIDALAELLAGWRTPRTLNDWRDALLAAVARFLVADGPDEAQQLQALAGVVRRLATIGEVAGHADVVPFAVVRDWIEQQLDDDGFGGGFLMGGMTVAALKPMRSLPFRVIAVAGLDDGDFPRRERRAAFDLLEDERRIGDRDLRTDDRQLFLDLLLAAGDRLVLAYNARAVRDSSPRAPSVVIDELLDHVDRRSEGAGRRALVVAHPLQPFSPAYFAAGRDPRLFTFSRAQARAAQASTRPDATDRPFIAAGDRVTDADSDPTPDLSLRDLAECWMNPSRHFCRRTLRFSLGGDVVDERDDEIFAPDRMLQGGIRSRLLGDALAGPRAGEHARDRVDDRLQRRLLADGSLPPHALGRAWHAVLAADVERVLGEVPLETPMASIPFTLTGSDWRLTGRLEGVRGETRFVVRAGPVRPEHRIRAWVEHVVMCAAHEAGVLGMPVRTMLVWRDGRKAQCEPMPAVEHAAQLLPALVDAVRAARQAPLPLFPQAAWAWLEATHPRPARPKRGKKDAAAVPAPPVDVHDRVRRAYHEEATRHSGGGDVEDPYVATCFRGVDPIAQRWDEFARLAATLFAGWRWAGGDA